MENVIGFFAKQDNSSNCCTKNGFNALEAKKKNLIGKRLLEARSQLGLSKAELRKELLLYGVPTNKDIVGRWERGETIPTSYQLIALSKALRIENISSFFSDQQEQVLNELGLRKLAEYRKDLIATGLYRPKEEREETVFVEMPVSVFSAAAGTGAFLDAENYEMISFPKSSVPDKADFGVKVSGDSMEPIFHDGQLVWVERATILREGEVGVFIYDDKGYIKSFSQREPIGEIRLTLTGADGEVHMQPVLVSYNKEYSPIEISPAKRFEIVGRVLQQA